MPILIIAITFIIVLGVFLNRWFKKASSEDKRSLIMMSVWTLSGVGLMILIITGRFFHALGWALMLFIALLISGASAKRKRQTYSKVSKGIDGPLTLKKAYAVLGLKEGASAEAIQKAYISLIKKNHPDQGGSDFLSSQINEAYDVLMDPKRKG